MSGAGEVCPLPPPESVAEALAARSGGAEAREVAYREEIRHPALPEPVHARGILRRLSDGRLMRRQTVPEPETLMIGESVITRLRPGATGSEILPIPEDLAPMIAVLRSALAGDALALGRDTSATLEAGQEGWRLALRPDGGGASLTLLGCGTRLLGFETADPDGVWRRTVFEAAR